MPDAKYRPKDTSNAAQERLAQGGLGGER